MKNFCSVDGCHDPCRGRGMCQKHYSSWHEKIGPQGKYVDRDETRNNPEALRKRFAERWKPDGTGCWIWTGAKRKPRPNCAYEGGETIIRGKKLKAHRFSWMLHRGEIPPGKHVLHKCHNSLCVNPDHLYIGVHADNMRDVAISGRGATRKLSDDDVRAVRALKGKFTRYEIADKFGVSAALISDIFYRRGVRRYVV